MKTNIYIITHKKFKCPKLKGYLPIQVGAYNKEKLGYIDDSTGENISDKNKNYCELTGIFWIWKNIKDKKNVGVSHYRRLFSRSELIKCSLFFITPKKVEKILKKYDIILPKKEIYKETVYEQYCRNSGFSEDLDKIKNIIADKHPDYIEAYEEVMNSNSIHQFNMLVCNKKIYNEYCEWLFSILFELEKSVDLSKYNDYQKRIYGFLSERLLNVWVKKKNLRVKEMNVINLERNILSALKLKLRRIKNNIIFKKQINVKEI